MYVKLTDGTQQIVNWTMTDGRLSDDEVSFITSDRNMAMTAARLKGYHTLVKDDGSEIQAYLCRNEVVDRQIVLTFRIVDNDTQGPASTE